MDRCLYASKPCFNTRSTKDNGDLHRLCLHHRAKANEAQRRWHSRQREGADANADDGASGSGAKPRKADGEVPKADSPATRRRRIASRKAQLDEASAHTTTPPGYLLIAPNVTAQPIDYALNPMAPLPSIQTRFAPGTAEDMMLLDELLLTLDDSKVVIPPNYYGYEQTAAAGVDHHYGMETYDWWLASHPAPNFDETLPTSS